MIIALRSILETSGVLRNLYESFGRPHITTEKCTLCHRGLVESVNA